MARTTAEGLTVSDLSVPADGSRSVRSLLARHVRRTLEILLSLPTDGLDSTTALTFVRTRAVVQRAVKDPAAARRVQQMVHRVVLSGPIHAAYRCLLNQETRGAYPERMATLVPELLAQMSIAGLLPGEGIFWPAAVDAVAWVPAGVVLRLPDDAEGVHFSPYALQIRGGSSDGQNISFDSGAEMPSSGVTVDRSFSVVSGRMFLSTHDTNPLSDFEAHPDKEGNSIDLSDRPASEWVDSLKQSLDFIEKGLPELRAEMEIVMQQWIPVGYEPERHLSASYQEAIGQAYLTLHPNTFTMMEAMVHEFQHNKVNALLNLDPLLENAFFPLFSSPVRPDPRPLHGVLLAVHAFLPVAELYFRLEDAGVAEVNRPDVKRRIQQIVEGNHAGVDVLRENAEWTPTGAAFFAQLDALDTAHTTRMGL